MIAELIVAFSTGAIAGALFVLLRTSRRSTADEPSPRTVPGTEPPANDRPQTQWDAWRRTNAREK